jgi:hypothetical protein
MELNDDSGSCGGVAIPSVEGDGKVVHAAAELM